MDPCTCRCVPKPTSWFQWRKHVCLPEHRVRGRHAGKMSAWCASVFFFFSPLYVGDVSPFLGFAANAQTTIHIYVFLSEPDVYLYREPVVGLQHFVLSLVEGTLQSLLQHLDKTAGVDVVCRANKPQNCRSGKGQNAMFRDRETYIWHHKQLDMWGGGGVIRKENSSSSRYCRAKNRSHIWSMWR